MENMTLNNLNPELKFRVLIVEDNEPVRQSMRRSLKRNGYEVMEAANGKEAISIIEKLSPDIVVTDILMPEMDGLEFIRWLSKSRPDVPVIVLTEYVDPIYLEAAMQLGASVRLHKPFKEEQLMSAIVKVLQKNK